MNENPGEMPNPLNPNNDPLDANPAESQPLEEIVEEVQAVNVTPVEQPIDVAPTGDPVVDPVVNPVVDPTIDPTNRPMEKAPVAEPVQPKKKKTGLIVAGIVAILVAIGCGVAAAIMFTMNSGDPVVKAVEKVFGGNMPAYASIDGDITVTPNDNSFVSNLKISLKSDTSTTSMLNSTNVKVTANLANDDSVSFDVDEMYGSNGDLYLKLSNVADALKALAGSISNNTNSLNNMACIEDENGETVCDSEYVETIDCETAEDCASLDTTNSVNSLNDSSFLGALGEFGSVIELIDGTWLKISVDELNNLTGSGMIDAGSGGSSCIIGVMANYKDYSNSMVEIYNKNPFISSTTDGVTLASKSGQPVRKIVLDDKNYSSFANSMKNSTFVKDLQACGNEGADVQINDAVSLSNIPTIYAEVDNDYNFSRLTFDMPIKNTSSCVCDEEVDCTCDDEIVANMNIDLSFSYPSTINVAEPTQYTDLSTLMQQMLRNMYSTSGGSSSVIINQ